ncbi:hypothetical protein D3C77_483350 [compost metagenome]
MVGVFDTPIALRVRQDFRVLGDVEFQQPVLESRWRRYLARANLTRSVQGNDGFCPRATGAGADLDEVLQGNVIDRRVVRSQPFGQRSAFRQYFAGQAHECIDLNALTLVLLCSQCRPIFQCAHAPCPLVQEAFHR